MSTRSGRAARELDDDIKDKEEAIRRVAHELATTARLNAKRSAEHETQEANLLQMEDIRVREADRLCV